MSLRNTTVTSMQRMFANLSVSAALTANKPATSSRRMTMIVGQRWQSSSTTTQSFQSRQMSGQTRGLFSLPSGYWSKPWSVSSPTLVQHLQTRGFAAKDGNDSSGGSSSSSSTANQHQEWVEFQKSIAVEGFETGQTTETRKRLTRGGRRLSKRKSKEELKLEERMAERQRLTDIGGGEYPPLRYSDAETERLLAQAYAALPARAGKRGTRNLKRQKRRWWLVRRIRKKYKKHMRRYQERKMAERSRRIQSVKTVLAEAPDSLQKDRQYQFQVLQRWTATMYPDKIPLASSKEKNKVAVSSSLE